MKTDWIKDEWEAYAHAVTAHAHEVPMPVIMTPEQWRVMQVTFYTGAIAMFHLIEVQFPALFDPMHTEDAKDAVEAELRRFYETLGQDAWV